MKFHTIQQQQYIPILVSPGHKPDLFISATKTCLLNSRNPLSLIRYNKHRPSATNKRRHLKISVFFLFITLQQQLFFFSNHQQLVICESIFLLRFEWSKYAHISVKNSEVGLLELQKIPLRKNRKRLRRGSG